MGPWLVPCHWQDTSLAPSILVLGMAAGSATAPAVLCPFLPPPPTITLFALLLLCSPLAAPRGVSVVLFGDVNDEAAFAACSAAGAAALCTDAPSRLVAWMRGAPPQQEQRQEGQGQGQG